MLTLALRWKELSYWLIAGSAIIINIQNKTQYLAFFVPVCFLIFLSQSQWPSQKGARGAMATQSRKMRMARNVGPIADCLIYRVTKCSGYKDARVKLSFPVVPFRMAHCHHANRIKLGIRYFCRWVKPKSN